jgi:flagellar basal-body rod modification protein FlgD
MTIQGISSNDAVSSLGGTTTTSETGNSRLDKNAFMKLLVTQMKNQDPMAPMDNTQSIAQLAQFSSLEQMQLLNDNIVGLAVLQQSNALMSQLTQSSALIGQSVRYVDPTTNEEAEGVVDSIKIEDGLAVLSIDGEEVPLANVTEVTGTPSTDETSTGDTNTNESDTTSDTANDAGGDTGGDTGDSTN